MKLKPCPFCGNKDVVMDCHHYDYLNDYLVLCNNLDCVAEGPTGRTKEKAAEAWNRRYIEDFAQKYPYGQCGYCDGRIMADGDGMQYCADCGKVLLKRRNKNSRETWFEFMDRARANGLSPTMQEKIDRESKQ